MMQEHTILTGQWMGRFEYDRGGNPTAFDTELAEISGSLSGEIREPNSFRDDMGAELAATLDGARAGDAISFVKRYVGFKQGDHPIYEGQANADLTRIEGRWRFANQPGWGGRFVMIRKRLARAQARQSQSTEA